jgi:ATP-dependent exoDNAse (exonuclease V) alpha subunit
LIVPKEDQSSASDEQLSPAYAITIHKSQGLEFPALVIPLAKQQFMLLLRNLIYAGITRSKLLWSSDRGKLWQWRCGIIGQEIDFRNCSSA